MRRVAIVGCRPPPTENDDVDLYMRILEDVRAFVQDLPRSSVVISGGAAGVDAAAQEEADCLHEIVVHLPDYATHGRRAPLERNKLIVADCDELHAWPAPWSRGTWHTIRLAREAGKPVTVHEIKP